jgi:hypothetical protein
VPGSPPVDAVSAPSESPSSEDEELVDERLPGDEELLELELLLELDGIDGIEAVDEEDELDGEGARDDDEDGDELGIDGEEDGEPDDEELGMDGMPLLLELCWVDSQPAKTRASAEAPR